MGRIYIDDNKSSFVTNYENVHKSIDKVIKVNIKCLYKEGTKRIKQKIRRNKRK